MPIRWLSEGIAEVRAVAEKARASGALVPLATELTRVAEHGLELEVRCPSTLALKELARATSAAGPRTDPFLPFERALWVADVETGAETYVLLLNKFPVMDDHVLLITREYVEQTAPFTREDFVAMGQVMHAIEGVMFYNGGVIAGASQAHRHFQLVPHLGPWPIETAFGALPFRHAVVRHRSGDAESPDDAADELAEAFGNACAALGVDRAAPLPPINLLATRAWLMVVPRTRERWDAPDGSSVSINALGFLGQMFVRSKAVLQALVDHGILDALDAVTR